MDRFVAKLSPFQLWALSILTLTRFLHSHVGTNRVPKHVFAIHHALDFFKKSSLSVEGGTDLLSVEIYNTGTGLWRPGFPLPHILRAGGYLPLGDDGDFVIIGGMQGSAEQVGHVKELIVFLCVNVFFSVLGDDLPLPRSGGRVGGAGAQASDREGIPGGGVRKRNPAGVLRKFRRGIDVLQIFFLRPWTRRLS